MSSVRYVRLAAASARRQRQNWHVTNICFANERNSVKMKIASMNGKCTQPFSIDAKRIFRTYDVTTTTNKRIFWANRPQFISTANSSPAILEHSTELLLRDRKENFVASRCHFCEEDIYNLTISHNDVSGNRFECSFDIYHYFMFICFVRCLKFLSFSFFYYFFLSILFLGRWISGWQINFIHIFRAILVKNRDAKYWTKIVKMNTIFTWVAWHQWHRVEVHSGDNAQKTHKFAKRTMNQPRFQIGKTKDGSDEIAIRSVNRICRCGMRIWIFQAFSTKKW